MRFPDKSVKPYVQPPLFSLRAVACRLEVLIDLDDGTAVITVEAVDPQTSHTVALVTKPVVVEYIDRELSRFYRHEFYPLVRDLSGPFA